MKVKGLIFKIFEIPLKFKGNPRLTFEIPLNINILPLLRSREVAGGVGVFHTFQELVSQAPAGHLAPDCILCKVV